MAQMFPAMGSLLSHPPFDAVEDPRKLATFYEEFVSGTTTTGNIGHHDLTLTGTGASVAYTGENARPGILTLTAATTGFAAGVATQVFTMRIAGAQGLYFGASIRIPTALTNRRLRVGLADAAPTATRPANGVYVEFDAAINATRFLGVTSASSTHTATAGNTNSVAASFGNWFTVEIAATSTSVMFYVNGVPLTDNANTANIPTASLGPFAYVGDGTNAQTLDVDFLKVRVPRIGRAGQTVE